MLGKAVSANRSKTDKGHGASPPWPLCRLPDDGTNGAALSASIAADPLPRLCVSHSLKLAEFRKAINHTSQRGERDVHILLTQNRVLNLSRTRWTRRDRLEGIGDQ